MAFIIELLSVIVAMVWISCWAWLTSCLIPSSAEALYWRRLEVTWILNHCSKHSLNLSNALLNGFKFVDIIVHLTSLNTNGRSSVIIYNHYLRLLHGRQQSDINIAQSIGWLRMPLIRFFNVASLAMFYHSPPSQCTGHLSNPRTGMLIVLICHAA